MINTPAIQKLLKAAAVAFAIYIAFACAVPVFLTASAEIVFQDSDEQAGATPSGERTGSPSADTVITPEILPSAGGVEPEQRPVALYFRMRGENMLARETRMVTFPLDVSEEQVLITKLIEGPGPDMLDLTGLFNPGTRVLPPTGDGTLLTVTLSKEFLDKPADVPDNWRSVQSWRDEVLERRMLALASIVNTITEETQYTSVQLLVQRDENDRVGRRVERAEIYKDGAESLVLSPISRAEELILSPHNTADIILSCWWKRDFDRLYRFVSGSPTEAEFQQTMLEVGRALTSFTLSPGVVSDDGQSAVILAGLEYTNASGFAVIRDFPMQMRRVNNLWKIEYAALLRLMEAD